MSIIKLLEEYNELEVLQNMERNYSSMNTRSKESEKLLKEVREAIQRLIDKKEQC